MAIRGGSYKRGGSLIGKFCLPTGSFRHFIYFDFQNFRLRRTNIWLLSKTFLPNVIFFAITWCLKSRIDKILVHLYNCIHIMSGLQISAGSRKNSGRNSNLRPFSADFSDWRKNISGGFKIENSFLPADFRSAGRNSNILPPHLQSSGRKNGLSLTHAAIASDSAHIDSLQTISKHS